MMMLDLLTKLPYDKALHYVYGSLLFALTVHAIGAAYSLVFVAAVAAIKEVYDYAHRDTHTPDVWDFVATVAGALVCASVLL